MGRKEKLKQMRAEQERINLAQWTSPPWLKVGVASISIAAASMLFLKCHNKENKPGYNAQESEIVFQLGPNIEAEIRQEMSRLETARPYLIWLDKNPPICRLDKITKNHDAYYNTETKQLVIAPKFCQQIQQNPKRFVLEVASLLVHELEHAKNDSNLNPSHGCFEEEVLGYWAESKVILEQFLTAETEIFSRISGLFRAACFILLDRKELDSAIGFSVGLAGTKPFLDQGTKAPQWAVDLQASDRDKFNALKKIYEDRLSKVEDERDYWKEKLKRSGREADFRAFVLSVIIKEFSSTINRHLTGQKEGLRYENFFNLIWPLRVAEKIIEANEDPSFARFREKYYSEFIKIILEGADGYRSIHSDSPIIPEAVDSARFFATKLGMPEKEFRELLKQYNFK